MDSPEFQETKCLITGLVTSSPVRYTVKQLCEEFDKLMGYKLPFQKFGFRTVEEYLRAIPDTVVIIGSGFSAIVEGVVQPKSAHINEFVLKQKKNSIPKHKRGYIKRSMSVFNQPPRLNFYAPLAPARYQPSTSNFYAPSAPVARYSLSNTTNFTNYCNQDIKHYKSTQSSNVASDLQKDTKTIKSLHKEDSHLSEKDNESIKSDEKEQYEQSDESSDYDEHQTRVPFEVQSNLKQLIKKHPEGISCIRLPTEYQKVFGKKLNYAKYNYRSLIELCSDLPEILQYIKSSPTDYILYDKNQVIPFQNQNETAPVQFSEEENVGANIFNEITQLDWSSSLSLVPPDVLHLSDKIPRHFPDGDDIKVSNFLDICIGEIYDISKFWVYRLFGELPKLMSDLQKFFREQRNKYLIPEVLLEVGLYCTTLYGGQYHRSVIVNLLPSVPGFVRVLYVDYGTVGNVPSKEIWYLPKQFGKTPVQAIRAKLAYIQPTHENQTWSVEAVNYFKEIITRTELVAEIMAIDMDDCSLELYIADVSNVEEIFYINEKLVKEGYAFHTSQVNEKS